MKNRGKKLVRNLVLIFAILSLFYYFGGYYLSRQQCVLESLRSHYCDTTRKILEMQQGDYFITIMADENDERFAMVGTQKAGFLYRVASGSYNLKINKEKCMTLSASGSSDRGIVVCLYRNDKSIEKVEVQMENGDNYLITDWHEDYACYKRDEEELSYGTYRAYNAEGELIGEEVYY